MMNMGLSRLILVDPPKDKDQEARKLAAGAHEIIEKAAVFPALAEALADHGFVIGTSRHAGKQRKNIRTPREMAEQVTSDSRKEPRCNRVRKRSERTGKQRPRPLS